MGRPDTSPATADSTYCVPATVHNWLIWAINYYLLSSHRPDYTRVPVAMIPANGCTTCDPWPRLLLPVVPRPSLGVLPYTAAGACTPAHYSSTRPPACLSSPPGGRGTEFYYTPLQDEVSKCGDGFIPSVWAGIPLRGIIRAAIARRDLAGTVPEFQAPQTRRRDDISYYGLVGYPERRTGRAVMAGAAEDSDSETDSKTS